MLLRNLSLELVSSSPPRGIVNYYFKATKTQNIDGSVIAQMLFLQTPKGMTLCLCLSKFCLNLNNMLTHV